MSSDGGSPTSASRGDSGDGAAGSPGADDAAKAQRISGSGGGLTKRISGRFSQEAFAAKQQELSFLQQRCVQFEVCGVRAHDSWRHSAWLYPECMSCVLARKHLAAAAEFGLGGHKRQNASNGLLCAAGLSAATALYVTDSQQFQSFLLRVRASGFKSGATGFHAICTGGGLRS